MPVLKTCASNYYMCYVLDIYVNGFIVYFYKSVQIKWSRIIRFWWQQSSFEKYWTELKSESHGVVVWGLWCL